MGSILDNLALHSDFHPRHKNTPVNVKKGSERREITKAQRGEDEMSALHQMVPVFFLIQFVVVLVALVSAMLLAD
jgi:hypothetical protein